MSPDAPHIDDVRRLQARLQEWLITTPVLRCRNLEQRLGRATRISAKLEFLQSTGTFKPRGALSVMLALDDAARRAGVVAVSAGNHAVATAFAARALGTTAKVVMTRAANPARIARSREYGAEVLLEDDIHGAFAKANEIRAAEGRFFVHPFEGADVFRGTATLGLEVCEQVADFDAVIGK